MGSAERSDGRSLGEMNVPDMFFGDDSMGTGCYFPFCAWSCDEVEIGIGTFEAPNYSRVRSCCYVPQAGILCSLPRSSPSMALGCRLRQSTNERGWRKIFNCEMVFLETIALTCLKSILKNDFLTIRDLIRRLYRQSRGSSISLRQTVEKQDGALSLTLKLYSHNILPIRAVTGV
jgi:hypothetical protein